MGKPAVSDAATGYRSFNLLLLISFLLDSREINFALRGHANRKRRLARVAHGHVAKPNDIHADQAESGNGLRICQ